MSSEAMPRHDTFPGLRRKRLTRLRVPGNLRPGSPAPPRKKSAEWQTFPEAMLRICSGYASSAVCGPVARARALRRPPEKERRVAEFPGGDAAHLSGLRVLSNLRACSPAKRSASRGIIGYSAEARAPAPRSAAGCVSAQSEYVDTADPAYPPDSGGDYCARFLASRE